MQECEVNSKRREQDHMLICWSEVVYRRNRGCPTHTIRSTCRYRHIDAGGGAVLEQCWISWRYLWRGPSPPDVHADDSPPSSAKTDIRSFVPVLVTVGLVAFIPEGDRVYIPGPIALNSPYPYPVYYFLVGAIVPFWLV